MCPGPPQTQNPFIRNCQITQFSGFPHTHTHTNTPAYNSYIFDAFVAYEVPSSCQYFFCTDTQYMNLWSCIKKSVCEQAANINVRLRNSKYIRFSLPWWRRNSNKKPHIFTSTHFILKLVRCWLSSST